MGGLVVTFSGRSAGKSATAHDRATGAVVWQAGHDTEVYASNTLAQYGFQTQFNELLPSDSRCTGQSDYVADQNPTGGTLAPYGSTVTMDYCPPAG